MSTHPLLIAQTAVLVLVSLAVLYPVVAYARALLYAEAVTMLAVSVLVFTVGSVVEAGFGLVTAAEGIYLLSALCFAAAVWLFGREFVRVGGNRTFAADDAHSEEATGFADALESGDATDRGFADATEGEDGE